MSPSEKSINEVACVASVSNRVITRKLDHSPPPPPSFIFFCSCPSFLDEPREETLATQAINEVTWHAHVRTPAGWGRRTEKGLNHWISKKVKANFTAYMFHSWVILHSYLINEPLVGFTNITRETFLWETNGQGTRNGGIIKEQLLSDLPQIGQVSGKFVKKIFISLVQCCMQRTTSRSTALMVELPSNHPPSSFISKYPVLPRLSTGSPNIGPYVHRPPTQHVLPGQLC